MLVPEAARAIGDEGPGPLPWHVVGGLGFTVDAASFPDSAGNVLEVYVRIPPTTLAGRLDGETDAVRLSISARLRNRFGAKQHEASQEFGVSSADTTSFGKVAMFRFPVSPGSHRLQVRLEDPRSRKRGLLYAGRRVKESASIEGEIEVSGPRGGRQISDLEFVWAETPREHAGSFVRLRAPTSSLGLLPNPERLYGLVASELRASFAAVSPHARPWRWAARVLDDAGQVVAERESTLATGSWLFETVAFDISSQPAGGYDLEVRAWQEGDSVVLSRRARFGVAWQAASWRVDRRDVEDVVHFLLDRDQEESFARMNPGEQERFLYEFWRKRDPTPDTAENEARREFIARIEHANQTWGRAGFDKGMFSDMGRVYIRYGEPDEVLRQVIPAGDQTLAQLLVELEASEGRPTGDVRRKGPGGDTRPFEVWVYQAKDPSGESLEAGGSLNLRRRIVFLFVDDQGYGDYRLRYSTE